MADESEQWLRQQQLGRQSSKDRWPYGDSSSPGSARREAQHYHPHKPSSGDDDSSSPGRARREAQHHHPRKSSSGEVMRLASEREGGDEGQPSSPSQDRGT